MLNIRYYIDESKKTVVAVLENCWNDFYHEFFYPKFWKEFMNICRTYEKSIFAHDLYDGSSDYMPNRIRLKNKYVGIAKCSKDDVFNAEYGKEIARAKVLRKYYTHKQCVLLTFRYRLEDMYDKIYESCDKMIESYKKKSYNNLSFLSDVNEKGPEFAIEKMKESRSSRKGNK